MLMDSVGKEVRQGRVGMAYFCSMLSGPSIGKIWMTGVISNIISATLEQDSHKDLPFKFWKYCMYNLPLNKKNSKEYVAMFWNFHTLLFTHLSPCTHPRGACLKLYLLSWGRSRERERKGMPSSCIVDDLSPRDWPGKYKRFDFK